MKDEFRKKAQVTLEVFRELNKILDEFDQKYHLDEQQYLLIAAHLSAEMVKHVTDLCVNKKDVKNIEDDFINNLRNLFDTKDDPIILSDESNPVDPMAN